MDAQKFSLLAAVIFAAVALLQLTRALSAWPVSIDGASVPVWASWIACPVAAVLAWLGFAAARR
jgi:hypothetical protein